MLVDDQGAESTTPVQALINVNPVNDPPVISSANSASIDKNTLAVIDVNATNGDGGADESDITYSLSGTDALLFTMAADGTIKFNTAPDFENPTDGDVNNIYLITVTADDGGAVNNTTQQDLTITVIDVDEAPVFLSSNAASFQDHKTGKPMGNIDFKFHGGKIDLKSTEIDYLVLRNHVAHFKGSGNLKGTGDVAFFVSLVDGKVLGFRTDYFRMKIWDKASGAVIYDNEPGAPLPSEASQALGNGSIPFLIS